MALGAQVAVAQEPTQPAIHEPSSVLRLQYFGSGFSRLRYLAGRLTADCHQDLPSHGSMALPITTSEPNRPRACHRADAGDAPATSLMLSANEAPPPSVHGRPPHRRMSHDGRTPANRNVSGATVACCPCASSPNNRKHMRFVYRCGSDSFSEGTAAGVGTWPSASPPTVTTAATPPVATL